MKSLREIQNEADLIAAMQKLVAHIGTLNIKCSEHGYEDDDFCPTYFSNTHITCGNMMYLDTVHEGYIPNGIKQIKELLKDID
jgi:hypothetical protein